MSTKAKIVAIAGVVAAGIVYAHATGKLDRLRHSAALTIDDIVCTLF